VRPLPEIHTGMLTDKCPRRVQLRIEGKARNEAPSALFRGVLIGEVLRSVHENGAWQNDEAFIGDLVALCEAKVRKQMAEENRMLTDAVETNLAEMREEIVRHVGWYIERFGARFKVSTLIGCELPCRMKIGKVKFASHLDLVFRDDSGLFGNKGGIVVWDWKMRQEAPTRAYLSRNLQLGLYWLMVQEGSICVSPELEVWNTFGEVGTAAWVHLPYLKPFGRATVVKDDEGVEREYAKGDTRPDSAIIRECGFRDGAQEKLKSEILMRVEIMRRGLDIAVPDPTGCHLCECEPWCDRFDTADIKEGSIR